MSLSIGLMVIRIINYYYSFTMQKTFIFIARFSMKYVHSVIPSQICSSVSPVWVLCLSKWTYRYW